MSMHVLVVAESIISGHRLVRVRERLADKLEFIYFDPYIQQKTLYKEKKKLHSL
ncbi:39S ribosomal protein L33, mitochondrial [Temnothorax curvispinosus]|uniref:39S ribosomal protein L33, mitochondrial n=1 Tax=Temnothorax curvispinosus TaxID=300111 RepID=A0A6J1RBH6_9HYME|nr:39S ribosomal protein L33, mitochondrial [Temnothorax curvispinosus]